VLRACAPRELSVSSVLSNRGLATMCHDHSAMCHDHSASAPKARGLLRTLAPHQRNVASLVT